MHSSLHCCSLGRLAKHVAGWYAGNARLLSIPFPNAARAVVCGLPKGLFLGEVKPLCYLKAARVFTQEECDPPQSRLVMAVLVIIVCVRAGACLYTVFYM